MDGVPRPRFDLSLLGRFELTGPDGVVDLPSKKLAGLLAYLACMAPRQQSREKLAALLWGSHFDAQAKQNLRQALFRLRKVLGQDTLESDGELVSLNAAVIQSDVGRFESLVREGSRDALGAAADLYQGQLVEDVIVGEEGWNEWLAGERDRLLELALGAMISLGEQELTAGRGERALKAGQRAVALNNMREDAHRLIVQALAATGRRAEALKHYQDLVVLLKHELNTEPDAATRSLIAELRSRSPPAGSPDIKEVSGLAPAQPDRSFANNKDDSAQELKAGNPAQESDAASSAGAVGSSSSERRQLTIMACNIVDSMALSARLDPEDMRDLITAFHAVIDDVASRFDGFVAQYLGDGVLVYFGYPAADEHDTEQAVRAGLAILDAVHELKADSRVPLQLRVGIATGLVVVGGQLGTGETAKQVAIGGTPNLAARLQAAAAAGELVIAASTHRLVGRMFDCRALAAIEVEGLPQPVEAWQVRGGAPGVSRFEARRASAQSALVGRREEIDLLLRRWGQSRLGEGRVVLLSGESGIGKSRIAESLLDKLGGEPRACFRYSCSPHHTHSPLHPFIAQLELAAGLEPGGDATAKLDRLEAMLRLTSKNLPRDMALIAELLGVPADERYPAVAVSPQQKREMILAALLDQLDGAAAQGRALILFEDAHWVDPTSQDLLDRMVARTAGLPVLLVVTVRPEQQPGWVGEPHVSMLPLNRLGRRDSAAIIAGIAGDRPLPDAVVEQVLARADGVPLFIEELTSALLESGALHQSADGYALDGPLPELAVPTTLQASLAARLDRLPSVRDVAQIGAAIGREFSHKLIAAVSPLAPMDLDAALGRLTRAGLISRRGTPPEAIYLFKHALVQDAAYATMVRSRRQPLHASIAAALIERFPALAETLPEVVAHHFTEAERASEAVGYWVKAGRLAQARWAHHEAVEFFEQALQLVEATSTSREALELAVDLRFELKGSLLPLGAFDRILGCLRQAEGPTAALGDQLRLGQLGVHMCHTLALAGDLREAIAFGESARTIAASLEDVPLQVTGQLYLGAAYLWTGDYRRAEDLFLTVVRLLDGERSRERFGLTAFPAVIARAYLTWCCTDGGEYERGIVHAEAAIGLAEALDDPYTLTIACWYVGYLRICRGEPDRAIDVLERALALAREWNQTYNGALLSGMLGYAYAMSGRTAEGIALLERGLGFLEAMGHRVGQPNFMVFLGEACALDGRFADASGFLTRALALAREGSQRGYEARALRLLGEVAARDASPKKALRYYRDALVLAEKIGMRPLIAHCHLGLGRLYQGTSEPKRATEHFSTAATMYRDLDMPFWLERADAEWRQ
ncbi:adenylate/guanylate cyclase family protein,transcriptional regulatory protein,putative transcriptional regulator [Bradyrhizobium sp. WSM1253]|nr:adenylate/guanylate cyclase family protein,transcriptional regulatory protein,putative transcriptional regulator [Bradyrhizobium sp. WSM1253]